MMFDVVKFGAQISLRNAEDAGEFVFQVAHPCGIRESILCLPEDAETRRGVQNLLVQVGRRIARDADVVDLFEANAGFFQAVTNRLLGETGAVLDAIEAFFFYRGDQSAVFDDCRCSIAVIGVDTENVHRASMR